MSVWVRGMRMPKACLECPFLHYFYSKDWDEHRSACYALQKVISALSSRDKDCPLFEIPSGHGNLVDVNEVLKVGLRDANIIIPMHEELR